MPHRYATRRILVRGPMVLPGSGAVLFNAIGTSQNSAAAQTSLNHDGMTVGAALTNGALIFILVNGSAAPISSVTGTWDNLGTPQSMFLIGTADGSGLGASAKQVFLFGLRNPHSGNLRAAFAWTGSSQVAVCGISFSGVLQSSNAAAFASFAAKSAGSTAADVTVVTASQHFVVAGFVAGPQNVNSVSDTQIFITNLMSDNTAGACYKAGAPTSVNLTAALNANMTWAAAGVDIVPA